MVLAGQKINIWEDKYHELALYNYQKSKGFVHPEDMVKRMEVLQEEYDTKLRKAAVDLGWVVWE